MLIVRQGNQVFVSESFDLTTARKLQFLFFGAQQSAETQQAAHASPPADELTTHLTQDDGRLRPDEGILAALADCPGVPEAQWSTVSLPCHRYT